MASTHILCIKRIESDIIYVIGAGFSKEGYNIVIGDGLMTVEYPCDTATCSISKTWGRYTGYQSEEGRRGLWAHLIEADEGHEQADVGLREAVTCQVPRLAKDTLHPIQIAEQMPAKSNWLFHDLVKASIDLL